MAQPLTVAFPPTLRITDGWRVSIRAVDPATGADVAGVRISEALMQVENIAGTDLSSGVWKALLLRTGVGA